MSEKWTPGPWVQHHALPGENIRIRAGNEPIAQVSLTPDMRANARLIAAAPAMAEALAEVQHALDGKWRLPDPIANKMRAALASARPDTDAAS